MAREPRVPKPGQRRPTLDDAAYLSALHPHRLKALGKLVKALYVAEGTDPDNECEEMTLIPYSLNPSVAQRLDGHRMGIAVWEKYQPNDDGNLLGVIAPFGPEQWTYVPAAAMPEIDRIAVVSVTSYRSMYPR